MDTLEAINTVCETEYTDIDEVPTRELMLTYAVCLLATSKAQVFMCNPSEANNGEEA